MSETEADNVPSSGGETQAQTVAPEPGEEARQSAVSFYGVLVVFLAASALSVIMITGAKQGKTRKPPDPVAVPMGNPLKGLPPAKVAVLDSSVLLVPKQKFSSEGGMPNFPCTECHDKDDISPSDFKRRKLELRHAKIVLKHGPSTRWCWDCHSRWHRDKLRLADGTLIPFNDSQRLCGQCHGKVYHDWKENIHGKRSGYWRGAKRARRCEHCHNPHAPKFRLIHPLPAPIPPGPR